MMKRVYFPQATKSKFSKATVLGLSCSNCLIRKVSTWCQLVPKMLVSGRWDRDLIIGEPERETVWQMGRAGVLSLWAGLGWGIDETWIGRSFFFYGDWLMIHGDLLDSSGYFVWNFLWKCFKKEIPFSTLNTTHGSANYSPPAKPGPLSFFTN